MEKVIEYYFGFGRRDIHRPGVYPGSKFSNVKTTAEGRGMYIFTGPETLPDPLSGQLKQLDYWTTLMFPSEDLSVFLFIRGIKVNPDNRRYTAARAIKEQAYAVHDEVVRIVTKMEIEEWELPKEKPETLTRDMSMRIMLGQL